MACFRRFLGYIPEGEYLSSGQLQLLAMTRAILGTEHNALLMIDEPELSLHIDWQRELIGFFKRRFPTIPSSFQHTVRTFCTTKSSCYPNSTVGGRTGPSPPTLHHNLAPRSDWGPTQTAERRENSTSIPRHARLR